MEWRKLFEMLFSRAPQYQPEPAKRDARTDKERYDDSLKKQGLYIPPKELAEEFYKKHPKPPKAAAEVEALMAEVRTDFSATPDKMIFFQKYTALFNCYAYASGGVGNR